MHLVTVWTQSLDGHSYRLNANRRRPHDNCAPSTNDFGPGHFILHRDGNMIGKFVFDVSGLIVTRTGEFDYSAEGTARIVWDGLPPTLGPEIRRALRGTTLEQLEFARARAVADAINAEIAAISSELR